MSMNPKSANHHLPVGNRPDRLSHPTLSVGRSGHVEEPSDTQAGGFSSIMKGYSLVFAAFALSVLLFITVAAFAAYQSPDPTPLIRPVAAAILAVSALIGGIVAGKRNPACPVVAGLICGGLTTALLILLSLLFRGERDLLAAAYVMSLTADNVIKPVWARDTACVPILGSNTAPASV
jgi:putative membrane protein (TIGR04086 family)